jgi:Ca2+/H+ antiporter
MVTGAIAVVVVTALGATVIEILLVVPLMCLVAAWLAQKLHRACD